ncbi:MAG: hypothetical protein HPY83_12570 [Anaerolineae bacterium]|nr:hypothetical protein [Anaerolineae bacterium]
MRTDRTAIEAVPEWVWVLLLLALSLFSVGPLFMPGYHWGAQDARHSVYFLHQFDRAIQDGILYPRWAPDFTFGYGYPFFNIYGPLSSYLGEALHLLGLGLVEAVKGVFGLAAVASALTAYLWLRLYSHPPGALLGALLYLYAPYHLADLYVRASLAETVALAFVPLCLWAFGRLYPGLRQRSPAPPMAPHPSDHTAEPTPRPTDRRGEPCVRPQRIRLRHKRANMALKRANTRFAPTAGAQADLGRAHRLPNVTGVLLAGLAYAGLMLSSNLVALLFSPILGGYTLLRAWHLCRSTPTWRPLSRQSWPSVLGHAIHTMAPAAGAVLLGLGLSAIFWLPAFLEYAYVRTDQWVGGYYEYRHHFVYPFQLFRLDWGFGVSLPGPDDGMSFQLGLAPLTLAALSLLYWPRLPQAWRRSALYLGAVTLGVVFLMLPLSEPVWDALGLVRFAQFPWRLLALTIVCLAFLGTGPFTRWHPDRSALALTGLWALLVILPVYPYLHSEVRPPPEGPVSLQGLMRFQQSADEMTGSTAWVQEIPRWSPLADQIMAGIEITTKVDYVQAYATGRLAVHSLEMGTTYERVWFQAEDDAQVIRFHTFYHPGWNAYILDEDTGEVSGTAPVVPEGELGLISVPVPQGRHVLLLVFEDTPVRRLGTGLTLLTGMAYGLAAVARILCRPGAMRP